VNNYFIQIYKLINL